MPLHYVVSDGANLFACYSSAEDAAAAKAALISAGATEADITVTPTVAGGVFEQTCEDYLDNKNVIVSNAIALLETRPT